MLLLFEFASTDYFDLLPSDFVASIFTLLFFLSLTSYVISFLTGLSFGYY